MKLEIRKISLGTLIFSAFPLVLFGLAAARALLAPGDLPPGATVMQTVMAVTIMILVDTAVMLTLSLVTVFVYNTFCAFGIKGVRIDIEEVEEVSGAAADESN